MIANNNGKQDMTNGVRAGAFGNDNEGRIMGREVAFIDCNVSDISSLISGLRPGEASLRIKDLLMGVRLTKSRCPDVRPVPKPAGAFRFYLESVLVASGLCQSGSSGLTPLITDRKSVV